MTHPILTDHPRHAEHIEQVSALEEAHRAWLERGRRARAEYEEALAEFKRAQVEALKTGAEPPPEPDVPPGDADQGRWFVEERSRLRSDRKTLIVELAPYLEESAKRREAELLDAASALLDQIRPIAQEIETLAGMLREARTAVYASNGVHPTTRARTRSTVSVADLAALIEEDHRPLAPIPEGDTR